jgi:hypothetical protein
MKKRFGIYAITIVIAGLMISSVASIPAELPTEEISTYCRELDLTPCYKEIELTNQMTLEKSNKLMAPLDSYIIYDTEYDDKHPTVAGDSSGRFFACMELTTDGVDYYPDFWYSLDDGMTWEEAGFFSESMDSQYPDVDANEFGFFGTFGGPDIDRGQIWLVDAKDLNNIQGYSWAFSSNGFDDFVHNSISCYTKSDADWDFGGEALTGYNGYSGSDVDGCPFIFYPADDTLRAWIAWLSNSEDYLHSDFAIDEVTEMAYSVYDNEVEANLLVRKDNFGVRDADGRHSYVGAYSVGDGETNLSNPSIEAHDNNVVLVAEEAGDIVCIYSSNGFSSQSKTTVVTAAISPEVKVTFDGELYACSYIKGGAVYRKISEDGGATWTDEQMIDESQAVAEFGTHDLARGKKGIYSVWEDVRGTDIDIYFAQAVEVQSPELDIIEIKGPIGVTATIKNIGDADATTVEWTMTVQGGLLGQIDKEKTGSEATLAVGAEIKAKSGILLGLGKITINVEVTCAEGVSDTDEATGTQIFIFSLV